MDAIAEFNTTIGEFHLSGNSATFLLMMDKDADHLIAKNLRRIRVSKALSQAEMGALVGMDKDKISAYENGHIVMGKGVMMRFCKAFNLDLWEFYVTENAPIVSDPYELKVLDIARKAKAEGIAEELMEYAVYRVNKKAAPDVSTAQDRMEDKRKIVKELYREAKRQGKSQIIDQHLEHLAGLRRDGRKKKKAS